MNFFSDLKMSKPYLKISKSYNLTNIEKMWKDYEALFCADGEKFKKEYKEVCDKSLELYSEKIDEYNKNLSLYLLDIVPTKLPNTLN